MENIMLQDEKKEMIKIVDFGLSNQFDDVNPLKTQCGSPEYAAPELFVKGKKYGPEVDLWSLGVILYVMGCGRLPFVSPRDGQTTSDERRRRLMAQINRGLTEAQERVIINLTPEYKSLLARLLTPTPHKRISIAELTEHPWITKRSSFKIPNYRVDSEGCIRANHDLIVNELYTVVNLSRKDIELDIVTKRYGKLGGMYNILAHEIQRNPQYKFKQSLNKTRSMRRSSIKTTYSNRNSINLTPSQMKINNAFLRAQTFNKNIKGQGATLVATPHKLMPKDSSCQYEPSIPTNKKSIATAPMVHKKLIKHNNAVLDEQNILQSIKKTLDDKQQALSNHHHHHPHPHHQRLQKTASKVPAPVISFPKCVLRPYAQLNPSQSERSKFGHHDRRPDKQPEKSSQIPKILQSVRGKHLQQTMSMQSQPTLKSAASTARRSDEADNREKLIRITKSKPDAAKTQTPAGPGRVEKISKPRESAADIISKLLPIKESNNIRGHSKKPRNVMKTLDKFKWTNCIFTQSNLESEEKKKISKSKMESFSRNNDNFPEVLKSYTRSRHVAPNKFN